MHGFDTEEEVSFPKQKFARATKPASALIRARWATNYLGIMRVIVKGEGKLALQKGQATILASKLGRSFTVDLAAALDAVEADLSAVILAGQPQRRNLRRLTLGHS